MIVTCPSCDTRFMVDDGALGGDAGRRVRCANCGNLWHYTPESAAIHAAVAEATASAAAAAAAPHPPASPILLPPPSEPLRLGPPRELRLGTRPEARDQAPNQPRVGDIRGEGRIDPRIDVPGDAAPRPAAPTVVGRPSVVVELPAAARRRKRRVVGLLVTILLIAAVLAAALHRDQLLAYWPQIKALYAKVQPPENPNAGLEVKVTPTRTPDSLVIDGNIVNNATSERRVPRLRVILRDNSNQEIDSQVIDPPVERMAPGASAKFSTVFQHPSDAATSAAVTFVTN